MTHKEITKALRDLRPDSEWTLSGETYSDLQWLDTKSAQPTLEEIKAAIANPLPEPELTVSDKLASVGLSIDDLKAALGL
jgi:hypothetical protein